MGDYELRHKKQPGGNTLKYGGKGGEYDNHAHSGSGRSQENNTKVTKGEGYNKPTPHSSGAVVRDGTQGHGSAKRSYQTDAHSTSHHHHGEAVGSKDDNRPFKWDSPLYAEGKKNYMSEDRGQTFEKSHDHGTPNKAAHHPRMSEEPHRFSRPPLTDAHGYGHSATERKGHLRMSGHPDAHCVGHCPTPKRPTYKGKSLHSR